VASTGSALSHLECPKCGRRVDADMIQQLCECGSPLLARYDLDRAAAQLSRGSIARRDDDLWRWRELLPVRDDDNCVSLGERQTPIVPLPALGGATGLARLMVKDESMLPTGSFKARGAAVGVSRAKELGVRAFAMPTNGNAGGAWAAYGPSRRDGRVHRHAQIRSAHPSI
jgi:threonine synthase